MKPETPNDLVAPNDAAAMLSVNPKTVSRWANGGKIHAVRTPGGHRRFLRSEILALVADSGRPLESAKPAGSVVDSELDRARVERRRREDPSDADRWAASLVAEAVGQAARAQAEQAAREAVETAAAVDAAVHTTSAAARRAREVRLQAALAAAEAIAQEAATAAAQVKLRADTTARELCESASGAAELVLVAHHAGRDFEDPDLVLERALAAVAASVAAAEESVYAAIRVATAVATAAATVAARVAAEDVAIEEEVARVAAAHQVTATAQARHKASDVDALARATAMVANEAARAVRRHARERDHPAAVTRTTDGAVKGNLAE